ncbi:diguanylate cyclase [Bradyrhizobium sp. Leo170]|uniref:diguanylate cyclase n=2 Tax=unclassified Bradyrhizobium TaxID=2631580 RepID=UPI0024C00FE9|nr:diguanylate cyclase [Bradyrhizobium sp. Leo170]
MALAERIRAAVADSNHPELERAVTVSIGIATFPTHARAFRELLEKADAALYRAKASGRNGVIGADA